jgi:hypothetical protein
MGDIKDPLWIKIRGQLNYDVEQEFTLKDGGKIKLQLKGTSFKENENDEEANG